jgi:hypothetical protein
MSELVPSVGRISVPSVLLFESCWLREVLLASFIYGWQHIKNLRLSDTVFKIELEESIGARCLEKLCRRRRISFDNIVVADRREVDYVGCHDGYEFTIQKASERGI